MGSLSGKQIVLAVSGGIAAYKSCQLCSDLKKAGAEVRVIMTAMATRLVGPLSFQALSGHPVLVEGEDERPKAGMSHIELARWAQVFLVCPCTANTLAKLALGLADDIVSTTSLATRAPQLLVPAMNPTMWMKPAVRRNIHTLLSDGYHLLEPDTGLSACGEIGVGRLPELEKIIEALQELV